MTCQASAGDTLPQGTGPDGPALQPSDHNAQAHPSSPDDGRTAGGLVPNIPTNTTVTGTNSVIHAKAAPPCITHDQQPAYTCTPPMLVMLTANCSWMWECKSDPRQSTTDTCCHGCQAATAFLTPSKQSSLSRSLKRTSVLAGKVGQPGKSSHTLEPAEDIHEPRRQHQVCSLQCCGGLS